MPGANTLQNWVPDFISLGISEKELTDATQGLVNIDFPSLFSACSIYKPVVTQLNCSFSLVALILFQDRTQAEILMNGFPERFDHENILMLMVLHPQLAIQKFQSDPALCQAVLPNNSNFLQIAALLSNVTVVNYLMNAESSLITRKDQLGFSAIFYAAFSRKLDVLEAIFNRLPRDTHREIAACKTIDGSLLRTAVISESPEMIDFVLAKYPSLISCKTGNENYIHYIVQNNLKSTLIHLCLHSPELLVEALNNGLDIDDVSAIYANEALVKKLFRRPNADVSMLFQNPSRRTRNKALHYAALAGCVETIGLIGNRYKSIYREMGAHQWKVLHFAIASKNLAAVQCLISRDGTSRFKETDIPRLQHTAKYGTPEMIDYFLEFKLPDFHWRTVDENSLSGYAVRSGNPAMLEKVLSIKPILLSAVGDSWSLLHHAVYAPNQEEMLVYLFNRFPEESSKWWNKNSQNQTPDDLFRAHQVETPSRILRELLLAALRIVVEQEQDKLEQAEKLINAYKKRLLLLFSDVELFSQDQINKILNATHLTKALGLATANQLKQACKLKKIHTELLGQRLCKKNLVDILESTRSPAAAVPTTKFFASKSMLCTELGRLVSMINAESSTGLTKEQVLTLSVILHDYQINGMHDSTRLTDTLILIALESSLSLQDLKPKARQMKERDIKPENFLENLDACYKLIPALKDDTKKCTDKIFNGIRHIITEREKILTFVRNNPGKLYEDLGDNLPLHTDHIVDGNPEKYYETLQRLVTDFLGAVYLAHDVGHLSDLCEKMTSGYCLEAKLRDSLTWASTLSEIQKFSDLMKKYVAEYNAYQSVMNAKKADELTCATSACDFIIQHHNGFICEQDGLFARDGLVAEYGVRKFLVDVLSYDAEQPQKRLKHRNLGAE